MLGTYKQPLQLADITLHVRQGFSCIRSNQQWRKRRGCSPSSTFQALVVSKAQRTDILRFIRKKLLLLRGVQTHRSHCKTGESWMLAPAQAASLQSLLSRAPSFHWEFTSRQRGKNLPLTHQHVTSNEKSYFTLPYISKSCRCSCLPQAQLQEPRKETHS